MIDSSDIDDDGGGAAAVCQTCHVFLTGDAYVQADERHVSVSLFCSEQCLRLDRRARSSQRWRARRRRIRRMMIGTVFLAGFLTPHEGPFPPRRTRVVAARQPQSVADSDLAPLPAGWYGPDWPPAEFSVLAALGRDAWIHPLAGPLRRMPRTDSRVFGAVRPGDRAVECRNGHCGVDLGGEIWGEQVRAVHDGVVDWVQRGANPLHGGRFVRISHRSGTVFTQYFHLAAIPRGLERGVAVRGGEVVGLLGDSGVHESAPHLHFTVSVRPSKAWGEKYVDPEPLIALWPLRIPVDGSEVGLVTTVAEPGVPLGSALRRSANSRKAPKKARGSRGPAANEEDPVAPPANDGVPAEEPAPGDVGTETDPGE